MYNPLIGEKHLRLVEESDNSTSLAFALNSIGILTQRIYPLEDVE